MLAHMAMGYFHITKKHAALIEFLGCCVREIFLKDSMFFTGAITLLVLIPTTCFLEPTKITWRTWFRKRDKEGVDMKDVFQNPKTKH